MTILELLERVKLHVGEVQDADVVSMFNRYAFDFVQRSKYGLFKLDLERNGETDLLNGYHVIQLREARINGYNASVIDTYDEFLHDRYVTIGDSFYVSVYKNKVLVWYANGNKQLTEVPNNALSTVNLNGLFWKEADLAEGLESKLDQVIATGVLYKIYSDVLYRNPEMLKMAEIYEAKYEKEIVMTKRRFNSPSVNTTFKHYEM